MKNFAGSVCYAHLLSEILIFLVHHHLLLNVYGDSHGHDPVTRKNSGPGHINVSKGENKLSSISRDVSEVIFVSFGCVKQEFPLEYFAFCPDVLRESKMSCAYVCL